MAAVIHSRLRPADTSKLTGPSTHGRTGIRLAVLGLVLATVALIGNLLAAAGETTPRSILPWTFGLTTTAFGTIKLAIAVVLFGILLRLWVRVDAIKRALLRLLPVGGRDHPRVSVGEIDTPFGRATVTTAEPKPLFIHRMAKTMWAPMLIMGAMAVAIGLVLSFVQAGAADPTRATSLGAWVQGLQFLGEGMLLAGISFLLGTILWAIRTGGGEVQASLGLAVKTLKLPATAKLFVALMMVGLMIEVVQFVLYIVVANLTDAGTVTAWQAWLGPFREAGLGLILAGIVMALVTIGTVLAFQFSRVVEIVRTGR